jgi:hypothetical protein
MNGDLKKKKAKATVIACFEEINPTVCCGSSHAGRNPCF